MQAEQSMQAEQKKLALKVFESFGQPMVWAMIKEVFRDKGMEIHAVRKGCIEIIFKAPISADSAKRLVSTLKQLEDSLAKVRCSYSICINFVIW